jgi:hypothetical protein
MHLGSARRVHSVQAGVLYITFVPEMPTVLRHKIYIQADFFRGEIVEIVSYWSCFTEK